MATRYRSAMRVSSPAIDDGLPLIGALALARSCEKRARRRRWPMRLLSGALVGGALAALAIAASSAGWPALRSSLARALALLDDHALAVAIPAGAFAWNAVRHARRGAERRHARSWLASAPLAQGEVLEALRRQVVAEAAPRFLVPLAVIAGGGYATGVAVGQLFVLAGASASIGAIAGWRAGARALPPVPLRVPRLGHARHADPAAAGFEALRRWPFAQWLADATPRAHARIVAALLLGLPMGIPLPVALLLLMLVADGLAAIGLLRALLSTIPAAADALRSTPLSPPRLAVLLCRRVLLWQALAAALGGVFAAALGAAPVIALMGAGAWLAWVPTATLVALACRHQPRRMHLELAAFAAALAALAAIAVPLLAIAWPLAAAWLWRRAANA